MSEYLIYDGKQLIWRDGDVGPYLTFKATSGMPGHQEVGQQCVKDAGPIPEGSYYLSLKIDPNTYAVDDGTESCNLRASRLIQEIPRGPVAGECEPFWENWGWNRVRLEPADAKTRASCSPRRSGFYLHDSTKGYSHGCIEVEGRFFYYLREYAKTSSDKRLTLLVRYAGTNTNGGTKKP